MRILRSISVAFVLVLFLSTGFGGETSVKAASSTLKDQIVGTWRITSRVSKLPDGTMGTDPQYGPNLVGYISYDNTGHMSVQFMNPDRPNKDTWNGYEAYFGTYTVDEEKKTVTHHIEGHLHPDRIGQDLVRTLEIKGDQLTLFIYAPGSADGKQGPATNINRFVKIK